MRISVISPIKHSGTTTASILIGQAISYTQNKEVMLTYTGTQRRICDYMNIPESKDVLCTMSQVVKLLASKVLNPKDLKDYCTKLSQKMYIMDTADPLITQEESSKLMSYVFKNIASDVCICDVGTEIYDPITQELFSVSDVVVIVIQPDRHSFDMLAKWKESEYWPTKASVMLVVNRYDEEIDALRNISKRVSIPHSEVCKIHYNPSITKNANNGTILSMMPYILERDPRVVDLNNDLKECTQYITSLMSSKFKWEV